MTGQSRPFSNITLSIRLAASAISRRSSKQTDRRCFLGATPLPWSLDIGETQATRDIYTSTETLLRIGSQPVRIIQRPLVSATYLDDIEQFVELECNQGGVNIIIFSAHGSHTLLERGRHRRELEAFDGDINISKGIRRLKEKLGRTIIVLDSCGVGEKVASFRRASGSLGTIGFTEDVDWIDSSVFILALLLRFQEDGIFHLEDVPGNTAELTSRPRETLKEMWKGPYKLFKRHLGIESSFARA